MQKSYMECGGLPPLSKGWQEICLPHITSMVVPLLPIGENDFARRQQHENQGFVHDLRVPGHIII